MPAPWLLFPTAPKATHTHTALVPLSVHHHAATRHARPPHRTCLGELLHLHVDLRELTKRLACSVIRLAQRGFVDGHGAQQQLLSVFVALLLEVHSGEPD